jgi:hypothetical protein
MKRVFLILSIILFIHAQEQKTFVMFGYNMNQVKFDGDKAPGVKDAPSFRIGIKAVSSDWVHFDVEYAQYSVLTEYKEPGFSQKFSSTTHNISFTPKLAITLFDLFFVEGGYQLAYHLSTSSELVTKSGNSTTKDTNSKQETTSFRTALSAEAGLYIGGLLISAYYEVDNDKVEFTTGEKGTMNTIGVRLGLDL